MSDNPNIPKAIDTELARKGKSRIGDGPTEYPDTKAITVLPQPAIAVTTSVPRSIFTMNENQVQRLKTIAQMVSSSTLRYGNELKEADAFLVILKGVEIGLEPMAALSSIDIIQGKPTLSPQGMLALINRTGELVDLVITGDANQCSVTMKRQGRTQHIEIFTMSNAKAQGLANKDNWKKQPATMLKWRAVAACARVVFPDVIQGLYTQEEIGSDVDYTDDGSVITIPADTAQHTPSTPPTTRETPPPAADQQPTSTSQDTVKEPLPRARKLDPKQNGGVTIEGLINEIEFMYPDDDGKFHRRGTIKNLMEDGTLTSDTPGYQAVEVIILHRAFKDFLLDEPTVYKALSISINNDPVISGFPGWYKIGRKAHQAWEAIQDYAEATASPPAKPKGDKTTEATDESETKSKDVNDIPF